DLSARLREPGFEYRATLESEMKAAVAGGVTRLVIRGARVIDPASGRDALEDLFIANGSIQAILPAGQSLSDFTADRVLDAQGAVVAPGLIDPTSRPGCVSLALSTVPRWSRK
ncbi:MAG: dihydroorotase, partial [Pseudomonadota bacterium]